MVFLIKICTSMQGPIPKLYAKFVQGKEPPDVRSDSVAEISKIRTVCAPVILNDATKPLPALEEKRGSEREKATVSPTIQKVPDTVPQIFEGEDFSYVSFHLSQEEKADNENDTGSIGSARGCKNIEKEETKSNSMLKSDESEKNGEGKRKKKWQKKKKGKKGGCNESSEEENNKDDSDTDTDSEEDEVVKKKKKRKLQKLTGELLEKMTEIIVLQNHT